MEPSGAFADSQCEDDWELDGDGFRRICYVLDVGEEEDLKPFVDWRGT